MKVQAKQITDDNFIAGYARNMGRLAYSTGAKKQGRFKRLSYEQMIEMFPESAGFWSLYVQNFDESFDLCETEANGRHFERMGYKLVGSRWVK